VALFNTFVYFKAVKRFKNVTDMRKFRGHCTRAIESSESVLSNVFAVFKDTITNELNYRSQVVSEQWKRGVLRSRHRRLTSYVLCVMSFTLQMALFLP